MSRSRPNLAEEWWSEPTTWHRSVAAPSRPVRTYYVSPEGDDMNSGRSPDEPWRTMRRLSGRTLRPGDAAYLKRGGVWREDLHITAVGTQALPITIGAYGTGAKPLVTGGEVLAGFSPSTYPPQPPVTPIDITEDFEGAEIDTVKWWPTEAPLAPVQADGVISMSPNADGSPSAVALYTNETFDLAGKGVQVEVPQVLHEWDGCEVSLYIHRGTSLDRDGMAFSWQGHTNRLHFYVWDGGVRTELFPEEPVLYEVEDHYRWRIREDAGVIYWEASPEEEELWEPLMEYSPAHLAGGTTYTARLTALVWQQTQGPPGTAHFDNFNIPGPPGGGNVWQAPLPKEAYMATLAGEFLRWRKKPNILRNKTYHWEGGFLYLRDNDGAPDVTGKAVEVGQRWYPLRLNGSHYVHVEDVDFHMGNDFAVYLRRSTHCRLLRSRVRGAGRNTVAIFNASGFHTIEECDISYAGQRNPPPFRGSGNGIVLSAGTGELGGNVVRNCWIYGSGRDRLDHCIYDNRGGSWFIGNFLFDSWGSGYRCEGDDSVFIFNKIWDCRAGIAHTDGANTKIYHNTFYGSNEPVRSVFVFFTGGAGRSLDVRNNIFHGAEEQRMIYQVDGDSPAGITSDHNLYFDYTEGFYRVPSGNWPAFPFATWQAATGQDANSIHAEPVIDQPPGLFTLAGSPAIGAAAALPGYNDEYGPTPNIGAYPGEIVVPTIHIVRRHDGRYVLQNVGPGDARLVLRGDGRYEIEAGAGIGDAVFTRRADGFLEITPVP